MTSNVCASAPLAGTSAMLSLPRARRGKRNWVIAGCAAVLVVVAAGVMGARGWFGRWVHGEAANQDLYTVQLVDMPIVLTEDGELKPKKTVEIKCAVEGQTTIRKVVAESTKVKKGDVVVELASDAIQERIKPIEIECRKLHASLEAANEDLTIQQNQNESDMRKAKIDLEVAELELRQYMEGDLPKSLKTAEIDIQQTEMLIARKSDELRKNQQLAARGFVTTFQLEQLEFELKTAEMTREKDCLAATILMDYERPKTEKQKSSTVDRAREELERTRARAASKEKQALAKVDEQKALLAMEEGRLTQLKDQLAKCTITAPTDGVVQYPQEEMSWRFGSGNIAAGEKVFEGQLLLVLPDTTQMIVKTRIHEADRHKVHEGLDCVVKVPAVPSRSFHGKVAKIAQFADSQHRWLNPELKEHSAEILLDGTDAALSPGDSAEIKLLIDDVPSVLAVPVQCVFSRAPKAFVFVQRFGRAEPIEVKTARASNTLIEITGGLSLNDRVLMHAGEDLLAALPAAGGAGADVKEAMKQRTAEAKAGAPEAPPTASDGDDKQGITIQVPGAGTVQLQGATVVQAPAADPEAGQGETKAAEAGTDAQAAAQPAKAAAAAKPADGAAAAKPAADKPASGDAEKKSGG
jgi:HlyD family secretion protein